MIFCTAPNRLEFHTLKIHHGGGLYEEDDILSYSDGKVTHVDWVNDEHISFADLEEIVYDLGYKKKDGNVLQVFGKLTICRNIEQSRNV